MRCQAEGASAANPLPPGDGGREERSDRSVMRRLLLALAVVLPVSGATAVPASAGPLALTPPANLSITSPFPPTCGGASEGSFPGANFNYQNSEVEPWLAVSPTNANDVAGFWQ